MNIYEFNKVIYKGSINRDFYIYCLKKNIKLRFSSDLIKEIIDESNYEEFGARKIDKVIKERVENEIIEKVLDGKNNILIKPNLEKSAV